MMPPNDANDKAASALVSPDKTPVKAPTQAPTQPQTKLRTTPQLPAQLVFAIHPLQATTVVVFIHGLGGDPVQSWGQAGALVQSSEPGSTSGSSSGSTSGLGSEVGSGFINRLQGDMADVAIAVYHYPSTLKQIVGRDTFTLQTCAQAWAQTLGQTLLGRFDNVVVIAHCLGGLLTTMAVRDILERGDCTKPPYIARPQLLIFLIDTPHDLPSSGPSQWLAGLLAALKLSAEALCANALFWRTTVVPRLGTAKPAGLKLEAYAITSTQPSWVSSLSAQADLPAARQCGVDLAHEALTKVPSAEPAKPAEPAGPAKRGFAPYDFVLARLREHIQSQAGGVSKL